jgi:regulator of replication initiation timing
MSKKTKQPKVSLRFDEHLMTWYADGFHVTEILHAGLLDGSD